MGRTKRLHTHWVPTRPPVATTDRSRFSVMISDTVHHTGGASPQLLGASLRHIWRLGGGVVRPEDMFRASSRHQQAHHRAACPFEATVHFSGKMLSGKRHRGGSHQGGRTRTWAGVEVLRPSVCKRAHHLRFETPAALTLLGVHGGSSRTATSA